MCPHLVFLLVCHPFKAAFSIISLKVFAIMYECYHKDACCQVLSVQSFVTYSWMVIFVQSCLRLFLFLLPNRSKLLPDEIISKRINVQWLSLNWKVGWNTILISVICKYVKLSQMWNFDFLTNLTFCLLSLNWKVAWNPMIISVIYKAVSNMYSISIFGQNWLFALLPF